MKKVASYFQWVALSTLLLLPPATFVCSKNHQGNAANDLLDIINTNRTAHNKLPELTESPGLGCIALQYAQSCESNCTNNKINNTLKRYCQLPEDYFTEIFAPNCGIELPTFGRISGLIIECRKKYLRPEEAFSEALVQDNKPLSILRNESFTQVGVGIFKHKGTYVWCVLLSDSQPNTTFVLGDLGKGIEQKRGCYSGSGLDCSGCYGGFMNVGHLWTLFLLILGLLYEAQS